MLPFNAWYSRSCFRRPAQTGSWIVVGVGSSVLTLSEALFVAGASVLILTEPVVATGSGFGLVRTAAAGADCPLLIRTVVGGASVLTRTVPVVAFGAAFGLVCVALFEPRGEGGGSVFPSLGATETQSLVAGMLLVADEIAVLLLSFGADLLLDSVVGDVCDDRALFLLAVISGDCLLAD